MAVQNAASGQMSPGSLNQMQRQAVLAQSVEMTQQIYSQTVATPANGNVVNIVPRNVGLIKRFVVEVNATANNTDAANTATLTDFGLANLLSRISFTDLANWIRINTAGWHLSFLQDIRYRKPYGGIEFSGTGSPQLGQAMGSLGGNWSVLSAPATIAHGISAPLRALYEVPIAYDDRDLTGAIYANVTTGQQKLELTINPTPFIASGTDSTFAIFKGATGTLTNVTITVYQVYLDQLPVGKNGVILPTLDLSQAYELKDTAYTGVAGGMDFPVPYQPERRFYSTFAVYDHDLSGDTGRGVGADINYWALRSANFTDVFKVDPILAAHTTRGIIGCDFPPGVYYFSHRRKPISTVQFGNMELVLNALTAAAQNQISIGWEDFATLNMIPTAGSLSIGA